MIGKELALKKTALFPAIILFLSLTAVGLPTMGEAAEPDVTIGQAAPFQVQYLGDWPPEAQQAFAHAASIWGARLNSPVAIVISASWSPMFVFTGCECQTSWVTIGDTWYPAALANALNGQDNNGAISEMAITCNSSRHDWYFPTDGKVDDYSVDLVTAVLHEIGHGLGFSGSMDVNWQGMGGWGWGSGYPTIYDRLAINGAGQNLVSTFVNPSAELAAQLTGGDLFWGGAQGIAANGGRRPKLHAPADFVAHSSFSHLDENLYESTTEEALMTPDMERGEAHHEFSRVILAIFQDMGWSINDPPPPSLPVRLLLPLVILGES